METLRQSLIERLARYLAVRGGSQRWADHVDEAASLLAVIKDPDDAMAEAGDSGIWRRMIDAALISRWDLQAALDGEPETPPGGGDEEGDMPLPRQITPEDARASWISIGSKR